MNSIDSINYLLMLPVVLLAGYGLLTLLLSPWLKRDDPLAPTVSGKRAPSCSSSPSCSRARSYPSKTARSASSTPISAPSRAASKAVASDPRPLRAARGAADGRS